MHMSLFAGMELGMGSDLLIKIKKIQHQNVQLMTISGQNPYPWVSILYKNPYSFCTGIKI